MNKRFIVYLSNKQGKLIGDFPQEVILKISHACSYKVDGAEFSELYQQGRWDGRKRLFNGSTWVFPLGLLDRVLLILQQNQIPYSIEDERQRDCGDYLHRHANGVGARPYQQQAVDKAIMRGRGILQVATGGGKTIIGAHLIHTLSVPALFVVHTKDLLYQAKESFEQILGIEIGQIGDGVVDPKFITVATMQSLCILGKKKVKEWDKMEREVPQSVANIQLAKKAMEEAKLIVWDEVHRCACDMALEVSAMITNAYYWIGLSASPWRDDNADLLMESIIGPVIYTLSASDLIRMGYLVKPIIKMEKIEPVTKIGTYHQLYRVNVVDNHARNQKIVSDAISLVEQGFPTLILVKQIKHGKALQKLLKEQFGPVDFISGTDYTEKRNSAIKQMRDGEIDLLIASTIADEGLDIKRLGAVILAGGGKSSTRALQRVGRVIRPHKDKTHAIVIDYADQCDYLKDQAEKRKEIYRTEEEFIILEL